ncbi:hypothetical protein KI688_000010 [Linnemannia hyalina]|uniref:Cas12f1-like TNB domain-containing protein n=1 Tax=Linnemannia hyalina TaxID=64524 RepID=A0A9P7Y6A6_9FUNG|nr:hypothetical protein KI688_000010 [Linnemannia hyalina]
MLPSALLHGLALRQRLDLVEVGCRRSPCKSWTAEMELAMLCAAISSLRKYIYKKPTPCKVDTRQIGSLKLGRIKLTVGEFRSCDVDDAEVGTVEKNPGSDKNAESTPLWVSARSLGYIIVGLNEYYTSKKCPHCGHFVAQVTLRRFYCPECQVYHHRDVMAAENMANIVRGYLEKQERPEYLHPVAADGSLPWMAKAGAGPATSSTAASSSSNTTTAINRPKG